jgi:hypothetical protein
MKINAVKMAKEFYETRNPTMRWSRLTSAEKVHMTMLAERSACMRICRERALVSFEKNEDPDAETAILDCINNIRKRGAT